MLATFLGRANEVRLIAQGIFDNGERAAVLKFVDDCEKLAASRFASS
jgi:hypothetical protein